MGNSKIDMNILAKRVELLEMRVKELTSVEPEALNERLSKIEERYFSLIPQHFDLTLFISS